MTHPDLDVLSAWVHGGVEPDGLPEHVDACAECRDQAEALRDEARLLEGALAAPADLEARLLEQARPRRSLLWQIPIAAAVLLGLVALLAEPGRRHEVVSGRLALDDGRELAPKAELAAEKSWRIRAVEPSRIRLADGSAVELQPAAQVGLAPVEGRGVEAELVSGAVALAVAPGPRRLTLRFPAGRLETAEGRYGVKIVSAEQGGEPMLAAAMVTLVSGTLSLSNPHGALEVSPGQSAFLTASAAPLLTAAPQDRQEDLLRRLEQLAAAIARVEAQIAKLEERNKQLKVQVQNPGAAPGAVWVGGSSGATFKVIQGTGTATDNGVILEVQTRDANLKKGEK